MLRLTKLILILCFINFLPAGGQYSRTMYFMNIPQARFLNPAFKPSDSLYIGLPLITGAGMSIDNNFLKYDDLTGRNGDPYASSASSRISRRPGEIMKNNSLQADFIVQLFGIAFKAMDGFIFIDINERVGLNTAVPRDILRYAASEIVYLGDKYDLSDSDVDLYYFREAGIGYSRNLKGGLRAGVKAKFLVGIGSAYTDTRRFDFIVASDSRITNADVDLNVSAPLDITMENGQPGDVYLNRQRAKASVLMQNGINPGFSVDFGVIWPASEKVSLSASVTDLGFISWQNENTTFNVNEEFEYRSFRIRDAGGNNSLDEIENRILDSLKNMFAINVTHKPFTNWLPSTLYAAAEYDFSNYLTLGIVSRTRFVPGNLRQSFTFSTNFSLNNYLSASLGYTLANRRYDNLGAGLAYSVGPFQLYLISDRIPFSWRNVRTSDNSTVRLPSNPNTIDIRGGINLFFGSRTDRSDCVFPYRNDIRIKKRLRRSGSFL